MELWLMGIVCEWNVVHSMLPYPPEVTLTRCVIIPDREVNALTSLQGSVSRAGARDAPAGSGEGGGES